jgi:electron transfer flavoprotein alpha/beta subunit
LNAIALVKHVPDTAQLSSSMDGLKLIAEGPRIINLKQGLAMGADQAVLLSDPAFEGGDTLATARALAAAVAKVGDWDLVIAGRSALDGDTAQTAIQVAALLDVPRD